MANVKRTQSHVIVYNWMQMVQCVKHLNCVFSVVLCIPRETFQKNQTSKQRKIVCFCVYRL